MMPPRVLQILRAPVGGLFRHVRDLVAAQHAMGLEVGVVCDSTASDSLTEERLAALVPFLKLGLHRVAMSREIGLRDLTAWARARDIGIAERAGVLHGHGAKGGAYARLAAASMRSRGVAVKCFYTPHGGSLHYHPASIKGRIFMGLERKLAGMTDGLIFESAYSETVYRAHVGGPATPSRVIYNGLLPQEFGEHAPAPDAADVLFVGELRRLKGVDVLLEALALVRRFRPVTAVIVGDGPDAAEFQARAQALGLSAAVRFPGAMPAARAFPMGHILAVPSRAESLPYIVLEAAAAGLPLVASDVGGIGEIVSGTDTRLVPAGDSAALAAALEAGIADPAAARARASRLRAAVKERFTVARMAAGVADCYAALALR